MAPRASRPKKIGVPEHKWSFDILTKWKKEGEHGRSSPRTREARSAGSKSCEVGAATSSTRLSRESPSWNAFGTNVMTEPEVRRKGVATALFIEQKK